MTVDEFPISVWIDFEIWIIINEHITSDTRE